MEYKLDFKCAGDNLEQLPEDVINQTGFSFPAAHQHKEAMSAVAKALRIYRNDVITRVPFCITVEGEAMGSKINMGDNRIGPRVQSYVYQSLEEMASLQKIDCTKGRIHEVLGAVEMLANQGEVVALSVEGPMTLISALIDPMEFFKGLRKNPTLVQQVMDTLEEGIVEYMMAGLSKGARIISYADPVGSLDIVGPRVYKELSGKVTMNVLTRIQNHLEGALVHLCGKTTSSLLKTGQGTLEARTVDPGLTYGQALVQIIEGGATPFIGHRCIKTSPIKLSKGVIWEFKLQ